MFEMSSEATTKQDPWLFIREIPETPSIEAEFETGYCEETRQEARRGVEVGGNQFLASF